MYLDFLEGVCKMLRTLNAYEKAEKDLHSLDALKAGGRAFPEMLRPYIGGPIPVYLEADLVGHLENEIDDEWCYNPVKAEG